MIGHELSGRYEIVSRVGGGGMAIVYKAQDKLLNRNVAVKVLRQQFVHDEDFIRRFRREAQSAAALSHPNVVSIYDVGQQEDIHYIVMEYVEGHNLNEIIKERAPLQAEVAIHIASQICDALDHAHQNGIIHRDIKPHNILIGRSGRVKVTDFGIARASAATDITQTGSVIGSVHYFSPEHAKGVAQGEKSDLYSLGIVMYQMLTNKLPFLGDSPISIALKHLQEQVIEPRKVNPMIPQSVENIILKALRKRPEERYQKAREMLDDLESALLPERINEAKRSFLPDHDDDDHPTRIMPAIRSAGGEPREPREPRELREARESKASGDDAFEHDSWAKVQENRKVGWIKPVAWMMFTAVLLVGMWYGIQWVKANIVVPEVPVPDVVGDTLRDASAKMKDVHLSVEVLREENHPTAPEGTVIEQDREPGSKVKQSVTVGLILSLGPYKEKMPDFRGEHVDLALRELRNLGVSQERIKQDVLEAREDAGTVLQQSPAAGDEILPDEVQVTLVVSKGPGTVLMPNLVNSKQSEAETLLTKLGLQAEFKEEASYSVEKGRVIQQHPYQPNDEVEVGATVTVIISKGLPSDALQRTRTIELVPAEEGKTSVFDIRITDAAGENREWGVKEVSEKTSFGVQVTVSPDMNAHIYIHRDDILINTYTVTYHDAQGSGDQNGGAGNGAVGSGENSSSADERQSEHGNEETTDAENYQGTQEGSDPSTGEDQTPGDGDST